MQIKKALVLGAGTMGAGIAQLIAQNNIDVVLVDVKEEFLKGVFAKIENGLLARANKGKMTTADVESIMSRISISTEMETGADADFVIEAILEDVKLKQDMFAKLDVLIKNDAVIASNTTACSLSEIASVMNNPGRFIGMHFYNPPVVMKLVEIMPAIKTDPETVVKAREIAELLGKEVVVTAKEGIAGITSRVLAALLNEAVWVLQEGIGTAGDIDKAMKMGANHNMGPLELIDLIGIDIHLAKTETLYSKLGDERYRPCDLLKKMVEAGYLGRKTGKGFYDYTQDPPVPVVL